jgi:hypothetical protein
MAVVAFTWAGLLWFELLSGHHQFKLEVGALLGTMIPVLQILDDASALHPEVGDEAALWLEIRAGNVVFVVATAGVVLALTGLVAYFA